MLEKYSKLGLVIDNKTLIFHLKVLAILAKILKNIQVKSSIEYLEGLFITIIINTEYKLYIDIDLDTTICITTIKDNIYDTSVISIEQFEENMYNILL